MTRATGSRQAEPAIPRQLKRAAAAYGKRNRNKKAQFACSVITEHRLRRVLLIGVDADSSGVNNQVESVIARAPGLDVLATGMSPPRGGTGWPSYQQADARALPFSNLEFDFAYANAVIEHVGDADDQAQMITEMARVAKSWIATTPNRLFPIEAHYHTLFSHWARGWSRGTVTRLLSPADFRRLLPDQAEVVGHAWSPTLSAYAAPNHIQGQPGRTSAG
jgi:hypothetical protein